MARGKSALSELLDALRAGGDLDVIREGLALVLQPLIDVEATQHIGARPYERTEQRTAHRNGSRSRLLSTRPVMSSSRSPSCGRAPSSRRCWSPAAVSTGPCWRW
jgi:Transposase, Mutator family